MKRKRFVFPILLIIFLSVLGLYPSGKNVPIQYIDRKDGALKVEKVAGENWLVWLYNNPLGKLSLEALVKRKMLSDYYGKKMDDPVSAKRIQPFVKEFGIDLSEAKKQTFKSFNDFFIRELKGEARKVNRDSNVLVSPADGKILAYEVLEQQDFIVKGYTFNLKDFLHNERLAQKYEGGTLVLVRLCPSDYHRFHFPVNGEIMQVTRIQGPYYSVSPLALRKRIEIFCENKREYTRIATENVGDVIMAEIGATMVGSIIQTYKGDKVVKGEEKGFFKFGGSSVLLLFEKDRVQIDPDLLDNTKNHLETKVQMGEQIGISKK